MNLNWEFFKQLFPLNSSFQIFLRSLEDLLTFGFIFIFVKNSGKKSKWSEDLLIKSSTNLFEILRRIFIRSQKDFYSRCFKELKKRTLNEIACTNSFISLAWIFMRFKEDFYVRSHEIWVLGVFGEVFFVDFVWWWCHIVCLGGKLQFIC